MPWAAQLWWQSPRRCCRPRPPSLRHEPPIRCQVSALPPPGSLQDLLALSAALRLAARGSPPSRNVQAVCLLSRCVAVTASQVPGSGGALALYLLPRFLLINTLDVPIQYKQQVRLVSTAFREVSEAGQRGPAACGLSHPQLSSPRSQPPLRLGPFRHYHVQ